MADNKIILVGQAIKNNEILVKNNSFPLKCEELIINQYYLVYAELVDGVLEAKKISELNYADNYNDCYLEGNITAISDKGFVLNTNKSKIVCMCKYNLIKLLDPNDEVRVAGKIKYDDGFVLNINLIEIIKKVD